MGLNLNPKPLTLSGFNTEQVLQRRETPYDAFPACAQDVLRKKGARSNKRRQLGIESDTTWCRHTVERDVRG